MLYPEGRYRLPKGELLPDFLHGQSLSNIPKFRLSDWIDVHGVFDDVITQWGIAMWHVERFLLADRHRFDFFDARMIGLPRWEDKTDLRVYTATFLKIERLVNLAIMKPSGISATIRETHQAYRHAQSKESLSVGAWVMVVVMLVWTSGQATSGLL